MLPRSRRMPQMGSTSWPSEDEEKLVDLVGKGLSAGQISRMMPRYSRNAIMGKVYRMRLAMARKPSSAVGIPRAISTRRIRVRTRSAPVAPVEDTLPATVEQPPEARAPSPPEGGSRLHLSPGEALMQLQPKDCRWPIGTVGEPDFHFCRQRQQ